jgi:hypothetical protein
MLPYLPTSLHRGGRILTAEAGVPHFSLNLALTHLDPPSRCYLATFMTNYNYLKVKPQTGDIDKLKEKLLEVGWVRPEDATGKWYLDSEDWKWKPV